MLISYKNLTIRNATTTDAEKLAVWWNDGTIMAHAGFPNGTGENASDIANSISSDTDTTHRRLIIERNFIPIGEMNYRNKGNYTAEIGIKICDFSLHDKGIGKILLSMLIHSLFNDLHYKKIILDTNLTNTRARHVYKELGFTELRINENSWTNAIGELQSSVDFELYESTFKNFSII